MRKLHLPLCIEEFDSQLSFGGSAVTLASDEANPMAAQEATAEPLQRPTIWNPTAQAVRPPTSGAHPQHSAFSQAAQLAYGDPAHLALLQQWYAYYSQHRGVPAVPGLDHAALDTIAGGQRPGKTGEQRHSSVTVSTIVEVLLLSHFVRGRSQMSQQL